MKKFALIILIICYANIAQAQSWYDLSQKAFAYYENGDYLNAINFGEKAKFQAEKDFGKEHKNYAVSLQNLAAYYEAVRKYSMAVPLLIEAIDIFKKTIGPEHKDYANSLGNLAVVYREIGDYSRAEPLFLEALGIEKKYFGTNHPTYASTLGNLGLLYHAMGYYSKAESAFLESMNIRKQTFGPNHIKYSTSLNNLAMVYSSMGDYTKAESLLIESLNIKKNTVGVNHQDYSTSLSNLGSLYSNLGKYSEAKPLFDEALRIKKATLDPDTPQYADYLVELSDNYGNTDPYKESLILEALKIYKNSLGTENPTYADHISKLAELYYHLREYSKAEPLFQEALNIRKVKLGVEHPAYAESLNNLAIIYKTNGNISKAELLYSESLEIEKKTLGVGHRKYGITLFNLALLYYSEGKYSKAEQYIVSANENFNNQIDNTFSFLSEKEKEQFLQSETTGFFNMVYSLMLKTKGRDPATLAISYNNALAHKGMLLQNNIALRQAIYNSRNYSLMSTYDLFLKTRQRLGELYSNPHSGHIKTLDSLENLSNILEKKLGNETKNLEGVENLTSLTKIKWYDVQAALKQDEAAIEFINFSFYGDHAFTDSTFYCALILRKNYTYPKMVYLFEKEKLQKLLSSPLATANSNYITKLYSFKSNSIPVDNQMPDNNILYQLVWKPIDEFLKGIKTIYLSPSGLLNKVAFSAIPLTDSTLLSDKYQINVVSSTRILAQIKNSPVFVSDKFNVALYGGIEYDVDSTEMIVAARQYQNPGYNLFAGRSVTIPQGNRNITWSYLPGTLTEVSNIVKLLKTKRIYYSLYSGRSATEESFKYLTYNKRPPEILHIATHGFFIPEIYPKSGKNEKVVFGGGLSNEPAFTYSENPLFRSGILLAGAGRSWLNPQPLAGIEDGILTAYEVSNLNLRGTKLVVLSACETGLGDIRGSEGVYGLQRAFKMAGAQYLVMSLWQVPDDQTSELMRLFYVNCLNGMNIRDGFNNAQHTMRKKYNPFYWAAFVLTE